MATFSELRSGREFRAYQMPDLSLLDIKLPRVAYEQVVGDFAAVHLDNVWEEPPNGEEQPQESGTPPHPAPTSQTNLIRVRGRKRALSEVKSDAERKTPETAPSFPTHRQRKKAKRRQKQGQAQHDPRRLSIVETTYLWDLCMLSLSSLPHASTAFSGRSGVAHDRIHGPGMDQLFALADKGFRYFADDLSNLEVPLLSAESKVFAVLVAWPADWDRVADGPAKAIRKCHDKVKDETSVEFQHRRGSGFAQLTTGISHGMGSKAPHNVNPSAANVRKALDELMKDKYILALFLYLEGPFRTWFPHHYAAYRAWLDYLESLNPTLRRPYPNSPFGSVSFNIGPRTVCDSHRDEGNEVAGICADVGLGKYKHQFGGHIVFHEAKAILELRPGRMLLFPSAAITHQNIPIGDGEDRMSATAHISGGIPQHIAQGMQGKDALEEEDPAKFAQLYNSAANAARWEDAVSRFLTLAELKEHWAEYAAGPVDNT